jgi:hypothetical protein
MIPGGVSQAEERSHNGDVGSEAQRHSGCTAWAPALAKLLAIGIAALSVALCTAAVALLWLAPAHHPYSYDVSGDLVVGSLFPLGGVLIAIRHPGNRCSWVLLSAGLVAVRRSVMSGLMTGFRGSGYCHSFLPPRGWRAGHSYLTGCR